jgi:hypothetical protein
MGHAPQAESGEEEEEDEEEDEEEEELSGWRGGGVGGVSSTGKRASGLLLSSKDKWFRVHRPLSEGVHLSYQGGAYLKPCAKCKSSRKVHILKRARYGDFV